MVKFKFYFYFNRDDNKEFIWFCFFLFGMIVMNFFYRKVSNLFMGIVLGFVSFVLLVVVYKGVIVIN